jgi:hypothetical protein
VLVCVVNLAFKLQKAKAMKIIFLFLKISGILLICGVSLFACKSKDPDMSPTQTVTIASLDTVANHFKFIGADKIPGKIPTGPASGSLKFSIKDTLHLFQGVYFPVKFLHDTSSNVTGVFIQVVGVKGGPISSFYFEVPEIPDMDSDTVSVVLVRFDPIESGVPNFDLPLSFNITITPHDENNQPLDVGTVPVKIDKTNDSGNGSDCGLTGGYWKWNCSFAGLTESTNPEDYNFYNDPDKIWGRIGQIIMGSCCAGSSVYGICPGQKEPNASLHFSTYSQYIEETLTFYENGTFFRQTIQNYATPDPEGSDFCSNGGGLVHDKISYKTYGGNWIVDEVSVPQNLHELGYPNKMNKVALNQTTPIDGGYGNPGGLISANCEFLILIQIDLEGFGQDLWKIYERKSNFQGDDEDDWYDIPEE